MTANYALTSPSNEADARAQETDGETRGDSPTPRGGWRAIFKVSLPWMVRVWGPGLRGQRLLYDASEGKVRSTRPLDDDHPVRVLSLMAGYGSDASEFRRVAERGFDSFRERVDPFPVHITGIEKCEARLPHLEKWVDDWALVDWREALTNSRLIGGMEHTDWDIIVTNPDFSHILRSGKVWSDTANKGAGGWAKTPYRPVDETMVPTLLAHAPAVLMLHHTGAFADSEHGRDVYRAYPPAAEWKCGRIGFRGDGKTDVRPYIATLWLRGHTGSCSSNSLPEFVRHWTDPPGSEQPSADLPAAPGWTPG